MASHHTQHAHRSKHNTSCLQPRHTQKLVQLLQQQTDS